MGDDAGFRLSARFGQREREVDRRRRVVLERGVVPDRKLLDEQPQAELSLSRTCTYLPGA